MYNINKKGFIIRLINRTYHIMSQEAHESRQIKFAITDSNCKFVMLITCICADRTYTLVALIYKGKSHNLQDS
jgi:hypothetical protein